MHHLYPSLKGDPLCPLGFHPQTRYPTRCKRCFRDYKEHGSRRGLEDIAASSPNLTDAQNARSSSRSWTSTQNLSTLNDGYKNDIELKKRPQSWASTPDIDAADEQTTPSPRGVENNVDFTVKLPIPSRRHTTTLDLKEVESSLSQTQSSSSSTKSSPSRNIPDELVIRSTDSLAERARKMNLLKKQRSLNSRESSRERSIPRNNTEEESNVSVKPIPVKQTSSSSTSSKDVNKLLPSGVSEAKASLPPRKVPSISVSKDATTSVSIPKSVASTSTSTTTTMLNKKPLAPITEKPNMPRKEPEINNRADVHSSLTIRKKTIINPNPTSPSTIPNDQKSLEEIKRLQLELEGMKARAERAERDKSDILLRRLASMDTSTNRTAASEALKLQQTVNELKAQLDKVNEEKRKLNTRMKTIEHNNPKGEEYELKRKLQAAEQLCEELMEENQQAKKEIINLQAEMDELQDTFRDDDIKAKTNLQKELEKTTKNCRILSFKLKKCERKIETLEGEKQGGKSEELVIKVKKLEEELKFANELTRKLQTEAEELRNPGKKKAPMLGVLGKSTSADAKFTRESLTRGGSQEDPQQLMRDLHDSIERESDLKDQLKFAEEEAENLRKKVARFEDENDSLMLQLKKMATRSRTRKFGGVSLHRTELQADRDEGISDDDDPAELRILLELNEQEASILRTKVEELERENGEVKKLLRGLQEKMREDSNDRFKSVSNVSKGDTLKLKKAEEENKKLSNQLKDLEEKIRKNDSHIKLLENAKVSMESKTKRDAESLSTLKNDYEKEKKERENIKHKYAQLETELANTHKTAENTKIALEKEIKELKSKSLTSKSSSKQVQELKKQITELQDTLADENDRYKDLKLLWEKLSEETILMRAQLTTEKENLKSELSNLKDKLGQSDLLRSEKAELEKRLSNAQKQIQELESKSNKSRAADYEKSLLKNKLAERDQEYDRLRRENEMNIDLVFQLRKDNDELSQKLNDFSRIEQAQSSIYNHNAQYENDLKALKIKLENAELQLKSDVAATRLRYEQQVKNLGSELTSMQRQCEKFKKDRDAFKQLLESAQKKIGEMKGNTTGRQSRGSMHSSDDDDKSKIAYLEQQIGHLEDQLVESRLEVSKVKTDLVSERSANEIKISEMQSKLNEFEEERVIGSGRTKIPGMKTKLELSWQKEREDQQRLLQETSTLARDLRQTLFEVERERDKERLESKRRLEQLKRSTEEELEEGRKKIAELQCDLLELRDVHAKLRTSNEKLRRERERYEKELIKRRMEQEGGEKKISALLQTVDELVKIAPDLKTMSTGQFSTSSTTTSSNTLRPVDSIRRSRSPSPNRNGSHVLNVVTRLAEASEELRKFQSTYEEDHDRRVRRGNLRRAASQDNDPHGSTNSVASSSSLSRNSSKLSRSNNGSIRKSLSLDHSIQKDQNIWRQDEDSASSMQSINSEFGGMGRDSTYDSRLSGDSTQSDITRGPRKKKKGLMGKLRSLTKSGRNSGSELSMQGSDSDLSVASDVKSSKKDLRGRLSGMFKRSGSTSRNSSMERLTQRPVAVTIVGDGEGPQPREPPPPDTATPKSIRSVKPPTPTTPLSKRRAAKKV